jgi:predicted Zn finger-like uncharacterized protein
MTTAIACPNCRSRGTVPDDLVGKKIRCRRCGQTFMAISESDTDKQTGPKAKLPPPKKPASDHPDDMQL